MQRNPIVGSNNFDEVMGDKGAYRAILASDSIGAYAEVVLSATSVTDNGDGTGTVVVPSGHGSSVGQPVRIGAAPKPYMNSLDATIASVVNSTTFTYKFTRRTHAVTSTSSPSVAFPLRRSSRGFLTAAETLLGYQFATTWCAVGGARAAQINDVVNDSDAGPYFVGFLCAGMNNIYSAAQSYSTVIGELNDLADTLKKRCQYLVILSIPPRDSGGGAWSAEKQSVHDKVNLWLYEYSRANGCIFINTWRSSNSGATYVNGAATNPDPNAAMTIDGTHPSMTGAYAIGQDINAELAPLLGMAAYSAAHPNMIGANAYNIFTDSDFATGATVATSWVNSDTTALMNVTPTMESRTFASHGDSCGRNQVLTTNYGTATGTASTRFRRNNFQALLTPGQTLQGFVPFSASGMTGVVGLEFVIFGTINGSTFWNVQANGQDSNVDNMSGTLSGVLITPPVTIPSGLTDVDCWVKVSLSSTQSADTVVKVWHPVLRMTA
jgi:hypothetical protein